MTRVQARFFALTLRTICRTGKTAQHEAVGMDGKLKKWKMTGCMTESFLTGILLITMIIMILPKK